MARADAGIALLIALVTALAPACNQGASPDDARSASDATGAFDGTLADAATDAADDADASAPDADAASHACDRPEAGAACTPGRISCGGEQCESATAYCCVTDGGARCVPNASECDGAQVEFRCEEASDCPAGEVCCSGQGVGRAYVACATECSPLERQVCRTSSECAPGTGPCGLSDCGGYTVQTCVPLPPSTGCTPL